MLFPFLTPDFEPDYARICDVAFRSGLHLVQAKPREALSDPQNRREFVAAVHQGFVAAQDEVCDRLLSVRGELGAAAKQKELALRKVIDGIAWQLIGHQLYIARRLYREQKPPSLHNSNFASVRTAARSIQRPDFANFALMSDLTTFVQVGDLLVKDERVTIVEVKEGAVNKRVTDFIGFHSDESPEQSLQQVYDAEGKKTFEQLGRMLRQLARMDHVARLANTAETHDPDSNQSIRVNAEPFQIDTYDERLSDLVTVALQKSWAIDHIDDCFFLGAYARNAARAGALTFEKWLKECRVADDNLRGNLAYSMVHPLAMPLFNRSLRREHVMDVLFGRVLVIMCVDIEAFMAKATAMGVPMRWSTRKEAAGYKKSEFGRTHLGHRVPLAGGGEGRIAMGDGVISRILYHGQTPASAIEVLRTSVPGG